MGRSKRVFENLEPMITDILKVGVKPQIVEALNIAVKCDKETGFYVYYRELKDTIKVWTSDIVIGNKFAVVLDELNDLISEEDDVPASTVEELASMIRTVRFLKKPNVLGDFHVHLSMEPISVMDMLQTMLSCGLFTAMGCPLNGKMAKITYVIWNPMAPGYNSVFLNTARILAKALLTNKTEDVMRAEMYPENILRSQVAKQYSFLMRYDK